MPVIYSPLSDNELDSICLSLVNQDLPYFSAFHEAFVLLYLTGCRVEEIFDINRWERLQGYEMMFLPQKDNYWRYVTLDSRCDNFIDAVVGKYKPFGGLSSGQLNSLFYNFSEYSNYKVGTKPVSLYLFRYNFIRRLFNDGLNINQIADKMGYTSTTVVGGYLTAAIEKGFFLDMPDLVQIGSTFWMSDYLNLDLGEEFCFGVDTFGDGNIMYYYKVNLALVSLLSSYFPSLRFPTFDEAFELNNVASSTYSRSSSLCIPSLTFWNSLNSYMINAFGFNSKGIGRLTLSYSPRNFKDADFFVAYDQGILFRSYWFFNYESGMSWGGLGNYLYPIRLVANV